MKGLLAAALAGGLLAPAFGRARARPPGSSLMLPSDAPQDAPPAEAGPTAPPAHNAGAAEGKEIAEVRFSGLRRVEADAVRAVLRQKASAMLSAGATSDDLRSIFRMGYFADAQATAGASAPTTRWS